MEEAISSAFQKYGNYASFSMDTSQPLVKSPKSPLRASAPSNKRETAILPVVPSEDPSFGSGNLVDTSQPLMTTTSRTSRACVASSTSETAKVVSENPTSSGNLVDTSQPLVKSSLRLSTATFDPTFSSGTLHYAFGMGAEPSTIKPDISSMPEESDPEESISRSIDSNARLPQHQSTGSIYTGSMQLRSRTHVKEYELSCSSRLIKLVTSREFDLAMGVIIILGAIAIFVQTDWVAQNPEADIPASFQAIDFCFTGIFAVELGLRLLAFRRNFFTGPDRGWHFLDTVVVVTALMEVVATFDGLNNVTVFRLLRILRMAKVTRVIRALRSLAPLRKMVVGILGCGGNLFWATILLFIINLGFAVCFTQAVSTTLAEDANMFNPQEQDELRKSYGTLLRSTYSLFKAVAGGQSWGEIADPLLIISPFLCVLFCIFVLFIVFAVLNVVTAIFVDNSISCAVQDQEMRIIDTVDAMMSKVERAKSVFQRADADGSMELDWVEFRRSFKTQAMQEYFRDLEIEVNDVSAARRVFKLLDFDDNGAISIEEFMFGLARLKGGARSVDVARILHNQKQHGKVLLSLLERTNLLSSLSLNNSDDLMVSRTDTPLPLVQELGSESHQELASPATSQTTKEQAPPVSRVFYSV
eukprot:gnl/MRDRNA2_/MRDRNA2_33743_c0_seq1.p1 gnl/MRDRNA2_/MRDRNA2_33743_c0~~gnl/MRDRNA2_/MRDRNA2_33743_c0_seq1.p1  ORF type:complete len:718 (+),score=90.53 gnl/MRDRNA2_/MRDRNA2_33743_c0_seq1:228-2156(+)